ncbi:MAG: polyphosphate kinase 2 family protein [Candidatus Obscuribacterales bacterium]
MKHSEKERVRERFIVKGGSEVDLSRGYKSGLDQAAITKETAKEHLDADVKRIAHYQDILYAQDSYALLIIFQAMDAAGKDSTIKHVMSGINPQGCQVFAFKAPSSEELDHDYLWRCTKALPERGRIGIFNRSYYEEVLVSRVHPEILDKQQLPPKLRGKGIWKRRFEQINNYEKHLVENGTVILKFFLNVSKKEQKKRFLARLNDPEKNWKFASSDAVDRELWDKYMHAYQDCLSNTSTSWAPWHVIPADSKPFCRLSVGYIIAETLKSLDLRYPVVSEEQKKALDRARKLLEGEILVTDTIAEVEAEELSVVEAQPIEDIQSAATPDLTVDTTTDVDAEVVPDEVLATAPQALGEPAKTKGKKDKSKSKGKAKKDKKIRQ